MLVWALRIECRLANLEVMGLNPAGCLAYYLIGNYSLT